MLMRMYQQVFYRNEYGKVAVFETVMTAGVTREAPAGAEKWSWDSKSHSFKSDWAADLPLQWALHPESASSNAVILTPVEEGVYRMIAIDWDTGQELGKIILATTRFSTRPAGCLSL